MADGSLFFITVCAKTRGTNLLVAGPTPGALLETVRHRHEGGVWFARLFLVMPDHVHGLLVFPSDRGIEATVGAWKRFTARACGIAWQDGFFDHRVRPEEGFDARHRYILENPVRAGLVARADEWPWVFRADAAVHVE